MNQKQKYKKYQSFAVLAVLCTMLAMPIVAVADASTVAVLNVVPTGNNKVITLIGNGFDANESVYLALVNTTTGVVVYNFTESVTTNNIGTFTKDVTLPSFTYGTYYIYAKTSTVTAYTQYTIVFPTNPKITVSPTTSNIIKVTGSGFYPTEVVVFNLVDYIYTSAYNFTDYGVTDALGNFTVTLIVPTSISGNYTLIAASTKGLTANAAITVPDLTGPKGDTGDTGDRGPKGATGPTGETADSTMVYVAIIISVISAVISIFALLKNRETDDEEETED